MRVNLVTKIIVEKDLIERARDPIYFSEVFAKKSKSAVCVDLKNVSIKTLLSARTSAQKHHDWFSVTVQTWVD